MFGSECTHKLSDSPLLYCGAPAKWAEHTVAGVTAIDVWRCGETKTRRVVADVDCIVVNVFCDAHRTATCKPIRESAKRTAPSPYLAKR